MKARLSDLLKRLAHWLNPISAIEEQFETVTAEDMEDLIEEAANRELIRRRALRDKE